jgi:hypothetical protein
LGGRKVAVTRPRARTVNGHEVPLTSYAHFAAEDVLTREAIERMLAGVATRRHARTAEQVIGGRALRALPARRLRLSRRALAILLGLQALPARRPGRDAHRLVPGRPEDRRTGHVPGPADDRPRDGRLRAVSTILTDKGLAGCQIEHLIADLDVQMLRPDRRDERARHGNLGGVRQ